VNVDLEVNKPLGQRARDETVMLPAMRRRFTSFVACLVLLSACFWRPLLDLVRLATHTELYSHVLLIPFVAAYLIWLKRKSLPANLASSPFAALAAVAAGGIILVTYWMMTNNGWQPNRVDYLCMTILSFVCMVIGLAFAWFGKSAVRSLAFPVAMLFFMIPFPTFVEHGIEVFFQYSSAEAASVMLSLSQTPFLREGLAFKLPGIVIKVAQECSGIRSTLVLFITSLVGGYMFFQLKTHRAILALVVIPIAILRNGFRIFTIAMLCVHVDPAMIHSIIHRRGGPLFFVLSLIPFFLVLLFLYRREKKSRANSAQSSDSPR
jgi:exosortase C (VPDSG-CTERM-specific)